MDKYVIAKYIRLSLEDIKYDSLSIPNQRLLLDRHIETLEVSNDGSVDIETIEFIDNGYSGVNFERPGVQKLIELVREGKVNCIVVKDFSRFGRNSIETGYFIEMVFPLFGTRFISISDGFDSSDYKEDTGGMQVAFKFLMHEYYSHDMSKKTKSAKYSKMRRGEYQSAICQYGYRKGDNGRLEIDEEAASVVRLIFETALTMRNAQDVVKVLYEKKIIPPGEYRKKQGKGFYDVSRSMGIWQRSSVLRILQDERYTGTYIIGKRSVVEIGSNRTRLKPESEWFKIPDHHPAIVSRELYDQVQGVMLRFKCPKKPREYTLRAKVFCGCCRHAMNRYKRKESVFVCRYTKVDESAECFGLVIGEQELENLLFEVISRQAQVILGEDGLESNVGIGLTLKVEQQADYERRIENCHDVKRNLYEQFILGEIDVAAYKESKSVVETKLDRLNRSLNTLKSENAIISAAKASDRELRDLAGSVLDTNNLTRPLVDSLVEKVYIYPGNRVEIEWKVADFGLMKSKNELESIMRQPCAV